MSLRVSGLALVPLLAVLFLQTSAARPSQLSDVALTETVVHVDVVANDRYVDQLREVNFQFSTGGKKLSSRFVGFDVPCSVVVVLDTSRSMSRPDMSETLDAISAGIADSAMIHESQCEYALAAVSDDVRILSGFSSDPRAVTAQASELPKQNRSLVYDACGKSIALLRGRSTDKRALVLISDGEDNQSDLSLPQLRRLIVESGVLFYGIYYIRQSPPGDIKSPFGPDVLRDLAETSGGQVLAAYKAGDVRLCLRNIAVDLRNQYSFSLQLSGQAPGKQVKLDLKLILPDDETAKSLKGRPRYRKTAYVAAGPAKK